MHHPDITECLRMSVIMDRCKLVVARVLSFLRQRKSPLVVSLVLIFNVSLTSAANLYSTDGTNGYSTVAEVCSVWSQRAIRLWGGDSETWSYSSGLQGNDHYCMIYNETGSPIDSAWVILISGDCTDGYEDDGSGQCVEIIESCSDAIADKQAIANANNQAHEEAYAACISCCGGIEPSVATQACQGFTTPYNVKNDGVTAWIEARYCNAFVIDGGSCHDIRNNESQCSQTNEKQPHEFCVADPIIVTTGNSFQTETDYQSKKPFGLSFIRFYNSNAYDTPTDVGIKWSHSYSNRITASTSHPLIRRANGRGLAFNFDGAEWVGDVDISDTLVETVDNNIRTGWVYTDSKDTVETYNATGQLIQVANRAGQSQTLVYDVAAIDGGDDSPTTLDRITGHAGETLSFSYGNVFTSPKPITSMTDPEGNEYTFDYDAQGNLTSIIYPDNTPLDNTDNPVRIYHYENTTFPSHLTGLTDETGSRVTWAFDAEGRAISSELDGGVDKSTLDFSVADQVKVTNPLGKDTTYHFETLHGVKKVTQVEGHATASCAGANQNYTYDANGYLESKTDWQGNATTYIHDARGLETSRTEASGTPEERIITTDWHNDFRLPTKITAPGQVTNFVYDTQGRLTSQTTHDVQ